MRFVLGIVALLASIFFVFFGFLELFSGSGRSSNPFVAGIPAISLLETIYVFRTIKRNKKSVIPSDEELLDSVDKAGTLKKNPLWINIIGVLTTLAFLILVSGLILALIMTGDLYSQAENNRRFVGILIGLALFILLLIYNVLSLSGQFRRKDKNF